MMTMHAVDERRYTIAVGERTVAIGTCSPGALHAFAAGRLLAEGLLADRKVAAIDIDDTNGAIAMRVDLRTHAAHEADTPPLNARPEPPLEAMHELFRELFRCGDERHPGGGVHVAALSDGERLLHVQTDVGRHNAVDKAIGGALLIDTDTRVLGLVVSARVSAEIACKAAAAGLAWIATRSVPTTLAVDVARRAGIPIVARAPTRSPFIW